MFDHQGRLLKPCELPDELASAIASFEIVEKFKGKGESRTLVRRTTKVRFVDRISALILLSKVLNFYGGRKDPCDKNGRPIQPPVTIEVDPVAPTRSSDERMPSKPCGLTAAQLPLVGRFDP